MSFFETPRFPDNISYGSVGGPVYQTRVITYGGGYEKRDIRWQYPRFQADVAYGIKTIEDLYKLISFFHSAKGMGHSFRYKDHSDFKSCPVEDTVSATDQQIGTGDNSETDFQLIKTYYSDPDAETGLSTVRYISKPVSGTVLISLDDVPQGSGWSVDTTTGVVTFSPTPPGSSVVIKAGYEFDVPARFNTDTLNVEYEAYEMGNASVPIIEDKNYSIDSS